MLAALFLFAACSRKKAVDSSKAEAGPQAAEQFELGKKYLAEEQYDEAIEALLKSIDFDDQYVDAYMLLGGLLKLRPVVSIESVIKALRKTLPERHHHLKSLERELEIIAMHHHETCKRHCEVISQTFFTEL